MYILKHTESPNMRIVVSSLIATLTLSALPSYAVDTFAISDDDGTYKTIAVTSAKECTKLCMAERDVCRGSLLFEETTIMNGKASSKMQCRLNDGLSAKSPFEITPPTPLVLEIAVAELNAYRSQYGLTQVALNDKLNRASEIHAADLAKHGIAAHVGTDGSTHSERAQRQNYYFQMIGENVATGQKSWDQVFQAWKDSPGHNKNLLAKGVTDFGIALVYEPTTTYTTYWAMLVGTPQPEFEHAPGAITIEQKAMLELQDMSED